MNTMTNKSMLSRMSKMIPGKADITKILLAVVFLSMVFLPLLTMFSNIDGDSIRKVVGSSKFFEAIFNSLSSTTLSTVITIVLAYVLAVSIERVDIRLKNVFSIIFVLPMLIPSISHGMGLTILFGNNGILTKLLNLQTNIYGIQGIVIGSVLYAFPVAFLMISDVLKYEDYSPYEAAEILGLSRFHKFKAITLPYFRKPLISVVFSIFTLIFTDYGVPLMVGGKFVTLPVVMYQEVIGQLDFGKGSVYGAVLLIPAVIAFIIDMFNKDKGNLAFVIKPHPKSKDLGKKIMAYGACAVATVYVLMPILSFIFLAFSKKYPNDLTFTFDNFLKAEKLRAVEYLANSLVIALFVAAIGVGVAFMTAYLSARMKSKVSRFLHLSSITSAAIPGVVLGLSYVLAFKGMPIYGTLAILIMVNMVHFIASPYLMIYNSLSKINDNIEDIAHTMGIYRHQIIRDVFIPQCKGTIVEMFSYFFVNCMITISAVSFLSTTANKPISLMINQFEAQAQLECAAVVSLIILASNLLVKAVAHALKNTDKIKKGTTHE